MTYTKKQLEIIEKLKSGYMLYRNMIPVGRFYSRWTLINPKDYSNNENINTSTAKRLLREGLLKQIGRELTTEKYVYKG